jgi:hypothetical protein
MSNTSQAVLQYPDGREVPTKAIKARTRMVALIRASEKVYHDNQAPRDARNMSYYRGMFWEGDGISVGSTQLRQYKASQNEVFPVLDTIASSLAMDLPQVEALDQRQRSGDLPGRTDDPTFAGRRLAAMLNWFAKNDDMDETVYELAMHALLFSKGGIVKTSWSTTLGRPIWRVKMPWDVFFDPNAKRPSEAAWAFERFSLHIEDLARRIETGVYTKPAVSITPDQYPRELVQDSLPDDLEQRFRRDGLAEYVLMHEFWDFRKGKLYHIHVGTQQILLEMAMPYGRPYEVTTFHPGIGRIRGVAACDLIADPQLGVNELVAARREIVHRLPRKMLIDQSIFRSSEEFDKFKNAKTWEPTLVQFPPGGDIKQHIWVSPEMPTTFDFNKHLMEQVENIKRISGTADAERGVVKNIRTAAEVDMLRAGTQGRMHIRRNRIVKTVERMFERALDVTKWAVRDPAGSGIDLERITAETQADGLSPWTLAKIVLEQSASFRLLPFSPLMEDRNVRREQLIKLHELWTGTPAAVPGPDGTPGAVNWPELLREEQELFNVRPSVLMSAPEKQAAPQPPGMPPEGAAPPAEGGVDGEGPYGLAQRLRP